MQIRKKRDVLARVLVVVLPGVMLLANSAYSDWRFYRHFSGFREKSFDYTAPIVGGSSFDTSFPVSVIVAGIVIVTWMLLATYVLILWRRASREENLGSVPAAQDQE